METQGLSFQWKTTPSYEMWEGDTLSSPQPGEKGLRGLLPGSKRDLLAVPDSSILCSSDKEIFVYLVLAVLGLHCYSEASSCGKWRLLSFVVHGLLVAVVSPDRKSVV